jgi:hypothetical protein
MWAVKRLNLPGASGASVAVASLSSLVSGDLVVEEGDGDAYGYYQEKHFVHFIHRCGGQG